MLHALAVGFVRLVHSLPTQIATEQRAAMAAEAAEIAGDALQSICYRRGSLRLLDQRKLPLETVYLDMKNADDGCLATAGYGTALGVIRALHGEGSLEAAFCTETRPFNQMGAFRVRGSLLLSLFMIGYLLTVIVGADRVAANVDTANKIGTYSLAVSAFHHGIHFYVAAPMTSIDLSLSSGDEIVIEERSPKELLNSEGGLGNQVAASGIAVWNPAFDVTPAKLITAIITEKGFIERTASATSDAFDINGFIRSAH